MSYVFVECYIFKRNFEPLKAIYLGREGVHSVLPWMVSISFFFVKCEFYQPAFSFIKIVTLILVIRVCAAVSAFQAAQ